MVGRELFSACQYIFVVAGSVTTWYDQATLPRPLSWFYPGYGCCLFFPVANMEWRSVPPAVRLQLIGRRPDSTPDVWDQHDGYSSLSGLFRAFVLRSLWGGGAATEKIRLCNL